ncbi:RNA-binding S4 domain-containing protein [Roseovarius sp. C7]|uniref:RNA-binding S4 domain-containing protein n=1 Tax=Roseovarius sp. C7 TaxID=3398643 RepID=UPI0039F65705
MSEAVAPPKLRLDKWLWHARLFKTRGLAAQMVERGKVRLNSRRVTKPAQAVRTGDVLTVTLPGGVRVLRVEALGERRGPAPEAQQLYEEIP